MRVVVDLSEEQLEDLVELGRMQGRPVASLIGDAITAYLVKNERAGRQAAFGLWKGRAAGGLEYQRLLRREWLNEIDLRVGDEVEVRVSEGSLIVTPLTRSHARLDLEQLVQKIPEGYQADEVDWGARTGREEW